MKAEIQNLIKDVDAALKKNIGRGILYGEPVPEETIRNFERKLGVTFPEDYRAFLLSYGYIGMGDAFIFGIWMDDLDSTSDSSVLGETLKLRIDYNLPHYLIPFYGRETFAYTCMNCSPIPTDQKIVEFSPPIGEIQATKEGKTFEDFVRLYFQQTLSSLND